jgi:peptidoglycan hydrolase FlgJ
MALPLIGGLAAPAIGKIAVGVATNLAAPLLSKAGKTTSPFASSLPDTPENQKLKKTADDFESMFLEQMVDRMNQSSEEGPMGENGTGGGVWRSMLSGEYAKSIAKSGGVGISDQIMRSMISMQSGSANAA